MSSPTLPPTLAPLTGTPLPLAAARALARQHGLRERVLAYVTRQPDELLVFEHTAEYPEAGLQVPAGGLEPGETPEQAAMRETWEETGLHLRGPVLLASWHWQRGEAGQVWHYVWLAAPPQTPDTWSHRVTQGERDAGLTFLCRFAPRHSPDLTPGHGQEAALPTLQTLLQGESP
ncbi:hypothetical protein DEIPH_ctg032orf0052 [Deinococcus phoenicis]|uniref:Nudix hydrolase domain-containing protein n=1 Tax=Deinococcus phoenicis TaxID=1476583 RepID=A0A016QPU7_9DEIO|nr:NUDIX domain-containing protein [Deinococcus phoenicis]EYB67809.1 hypothetical protein DEIPH_ctg032orf0052 [Deinococcus phoenicis]